MYMLILAEVILDGDSKVLSGFDLHQGMAVHLVLVADGTTALSDTEHVACICLGEMPLASPLPKQGLHLGPLAVGDNLLGNGPR
jgi:hypothetical protein